MGIEAPAILTVPPSGYTTDMSGFLFVVCLLCRVLCLRFRVFPQQPPPQIYDKQLDEREHTIEEWKGNLLVKGS